MNIYDIFCMFVCTFQVLHLHFPGVSSLLSELMEVLPSMAPLGRTGTSRFKPSIDSLVPQCFARKLTKPNQCLLIAMLDPFNVYFEYHIFQNPWNIFKTLQMQNGWNFHVIDAVECARPVCGLLCSSGVSALGGQCGVLLRWIEACSQVVCIVSSDTSWA